MINPINSSTPIERQGEIAKQGEGPSKINANIFKQALDKAIDSNKKEYSTIEKVTQNSSLSEINAILDKSIDDPDIEIQDKTDLLLKQLDYYSAQLENPNITLKNIEPLLEEIKKSAGSLLENTGSKKFIDENLINIAKQSALTANTEYIKFQRGDYI